MNGMLQPMDESKLAMDNYLPGLADGAAGEMSRADGKLYYVPSNWGTEALVASEADAKLSSPPSLGERRPRSSPCYSRCRARKCSSRKVAEVMGSHTRFSRKFYAPAPAHRIARAFIAVRPRC